MKKSNRVGLNVLDDEVKQLISSTMKIFPILQEDVDGNINPNNYEYVRVGNAIYRWNNNTWSYIIADDVDIDWVDIKGKPTNYTPTEHTHSGLHEHNNKTILDTITQLVVDKWNTVTNKADKTYVDTQLGNKSDITHNHDTDYSDIGHEHNYSLSTHLHNDTYYTETEIDSKLLLKSDTSHNHDGGYYKKTEVDNQLIGKANTVHSHLEADITNLDKYTKSEVDTKLGTKSETSHSHTNLHTHGNKVLLDKITESVSNLEYDLSSLKYIDDIRNGYTEGHAHGNLTLLQTLTQSMLDNWNSAVTHILDTVKHITSGERTLWNTVTSKEDKFTKNSAFNKNFGTTVGTVAQGNDSRLSDARTPTTHDHDSLYNTKVEITSLLSGKSDNTHTHDDRYYTEGEVDTKLLAKANSSTVDGHTGNSTIHVTQINKDSWDAKSNTDTITTINGKTGVISKADIVALGIPAQDTNTVYTHPTGTNPHGTTKADVGLSLLSNVAQMPIAGGTFSGSVVGQNNASYTTSQLRNVRIYADGASIPALANGEIALVYEV